MKGSGKEAAVAGKPCFCLGLGLCLRLGLCLGLGLRLGLGNCLGLGLGLCLGLGGVGTVRINFCV